MSSSHSSGASRSPREMPLGRAPLEPIVTVRIVNREGGCWLRTRGKLNALPSCAAQVPSHRCHPGAASLTTIEACMGSLVRRTQNRAFDLAQGCPIICLRSFFQAKRPRGSKTMRIWTTAIACSLAGAVMAGQIGQAAAAPMPTNVAAMKAAAGDDVTQVHWRGGGWGWGLGGLAVGAIIGGAIASSAPYGYGYYGGGPYYGGYGYPGYGYGYAPAYYGYGPAYAYPRYYGYRRVYRPYYGYYRPYARPYYRGYW
ncbi:bll6457 [Bradyrhizobium diazoefficiens USDA 110]|uniref:Bll6457 protein n=4 Tax=Bradyrhizobium diazoefficiens TaxID=1355477 RepID=Q89G88_BRADU|nr:hypothetical protein Bdiaspc4_34045 [Bradyrhizobium diazoefficiens]BAC51722.1 bll6457 [Bradyrhizobium diazoefficiens USDA 110]